MEKAFDTKELIKRLEQKGLPVAEQMAEVLVETTLDWVSDSVVASPNKYDDFAVPVLAAVKPFVMKELDKIDKQEG